MEISLNENKIMGLFLFFINVWIPPYSFGLTAALSVFFRW